MTNVITITLFIDTNTHSYKYNIIQYSKYHLTVSL